MISGTYVLTDTINAGFDTIFTQSYKNADVVITGKAAFGDSNDTQVETPSFPESILDEVRALPDVAAAAGSVQSQDVKLLRKNGKVINTRGAPNLGFSVHPKGNQQFNPLSLAEGRWPEGPSQIAIDKSTAEKQHYKLGETIGVQVDGPVGEFEIVGITKFGSIDSIGSATIAVFDPPT